MKFDSPAARETLRTLVKVVVEMLEEQDWGTPEYEILQEVIRAMSNVTDGEAGKMAADLDGYLK